MKRSGIWLTTVCMGVAVFGIATVTRAALRNPGVMFLAGQFKMMTGDNESGLRLISRAAIVRDSADSAQAPETKPAVASGGCTAKAAPLKLKSKVVVEPAVQTVASNAYLTPAQRDALAQFKQAAYRGIPPAFNSAEFEREQIRRTEEMQQRIAQQMSAFQRVSRAYPTHANMPAAPAANYGIRVDIPKLETLVQ